MTALRSMTICAALAACSMAHAQQATATEDDREATAKLVYALLSDNRYAYRAKPLDDALSARLFDAYISALSPDDGGVGRPDPGELAPFRLKLDDAVKRGALDPIYEISGAVDRAAANETSPRSRDEALAIFLDAYANTVDEKARYTSAVAPPARRADTTTASISAPLSGPTQQLLEVGGKRIGVIRMQGLAWRVDRSISREVNSLLAQLNAAHIDGVILDLRGSPGGAFREVIGLSSLFLGPGPVMQIREVGGRVSTEKAESAATWRGPLVVLVDGATTSGPEMVAAAIQDSGRGQIVGERTGGVGTVHPVDLDRGAVDPRRTGQRRFGWITLTIAEVFRLDGRPLDGVGVTRDVVVHPAPPTVRRSTRAPVSSPIAAVRGYKAPTRRELPESPGERRELDDAQNAGNGDPVLVEAIGVLERLLVPGAATAR